MSNDALDEYKNLYAEYIKYMVEIHNSHQSFSKKPSHTTYKRLRTSLYHSKKLHKKIQDAAQAAFRKEMSTRNPDKPINNFMRSAILKNKEVNTMIVNLLDQGPYRRGLYQEIADKVGVEERRVRFIHSKLKVYKKVLLDDQ